MAISYFTRFYQAFITLFVCCFPVLFAQKVCGRLVYVSRFPTIVLGYTEPPGWYYVDSFVFTHAGELQIGLEFKAGLVEYYDLSDLAIIDIGIDSTANPVCIADL